MSYNNNRKEGQNNYQQNRQYNSKQQFYPNNNAQYPRPQYPQGFPPPYPIYQNQPPPNNGKQMYGPPKNMPPGPAIYPLPSHQPPQNNYYYYPNYPQPYPQGSQGYMSNYPQNYSQQSPPNYNQRSVPAPKLVNPENSYSNQSRKEKEEKYYRKDYGDNQNYRQNVANFHKERPRDNTKNEQYISKSGNKRQSFIQKDAKESPNKSYNRKPQKQDRSQQDEEIIPDEQNSYLSSQSESEEEIFMKRKVVYKKKDPVLDSKQQIRKWIEARKRNYPRKNILPEQIEKKKEQLQLSILEKKIRKKICLINADPRSMLKKMKDIDILRRFMLYHRKNKRLPTKNYYAQPKDEKDKCKQQIVQAPDAQKEQIQVQKEKQILEVQQVKIIQKQSNIQVECEQGGQVEQVDAMEIPIKSDQSIPFVNERQNSYHRREQLSVDVIIKHLQMRQQQDVKMLENLMDYKSNSCHFRYQHQTLQTNLLLDSIFRDTSYMLQSIRYIVKNNFFDGPKEEAKFPQ